MAESELAYIASVSDVKINEFTPEIIKKYVEKYDIPMLPSRDIIGLALACGKEFADREMYDAEKYYLSIAYGLTGDKKIMELIESLPKITK